MPIWSMAGLSLLAALTAGCSCGAVYATTSSERPAASSHLSSFPREDFMVEGKGFVWRDV